MRAPATSGECSAAPAPGHAGHLATFPAGLTEPRTGRMPYRQPRDRHPTDASPADWPAVPSRARNTSERTAVSVAPAFRPTAFLFYSTTPSTQPQRVPRARGPDPLRAPCDSGSCPSRFSSSKSVPSAGPGVPSAPDAVPSALPGLQDGRRFAAIGPTRGRGERGFPVLRRHRPEVLCGAADHDSGRVLKRHGKRHPPAPG